MRHRGSLSAPRTDRPFQAEVDLPKQIGRFVVEELIGRGGMSDVYRAFDPELGRHVALKVLSPVLGRDRAFTDRFIRESRAAASLNHPHVVQIFEAGREGETLFIAMQLVRGVDLKTYIEMSGPLSTEVTERVITQTANALDHAHAGDLIHRDVKPANLMLEERPEGLHVYLTDFGLTKSMGTNSRITNTGELVGSVHYVSPEHLEGRELDRRTDVYSLGCVAHECLTGRPPFERDTDMAVLWAHLNAETPRPSRSNRRVPNVVDRVIARAMAKDPTDRFDTCGALSASLEHALRGLPHDLPVPAPTRRPERGQTLRGAAAVAAAVLLLGGSVTVATRDRPATRPGDISSSGSDATQSRISQRQEQLRADHTSRSNGFRPRASENLPGRAIDDRGSNGAVSLASGDAGYDAPTTEASVQLIPTRTERGNYDVRSKDLGLGAQCDAEDTGTGCAEFVLDANERFVDVIITDQAGLPVGAFIKQDYDSDPNWDGPWISLCDETPEPVEVQPGARVQIAIDADGCQGRSDPTIGTIVARLYRGAR